MSKLYISTCLIAIVLLCNCADLYSQDSTTSLRFSEQIADYSRYIDTSDYAVYRSDDSYQYEEVQYEESNLRRMWRRFWSRFFRTMGKGVSSDLFQYLIIILAGALVIYFLLKSQFTSVLSKTPEGRKPYVEELDIRVAHDILQDRWIQAKSEKDWRSAIRYAYLIELKKLDEKRIIKWKEWKLSQDYLQELKDTEWQNDFSELTRFFNYSWYGQGIIKEQGFEEFERIHEAFITRINEE